MTYLSRDCTRLPSIVQNREELQETGMETGDDFTAADIEQRMHGLLHHTKTITRNTPQQTDPQLLGREVLLFRTISVQ